MKDTSFKNVRATALRELAEESLNLFRLSERALTKHVFLNAKYVCFLVAVDENVELKHFSANRLVMRAY